MKKHHYLLIGILICNLISAQKLPKLIPVFKNNKWGFTNRKLQFRIQPNYDEIVYPFAAYQIPKTNTIDTLAFVKQAEDKFFINKKGLKVITPKGFSYHNRLNAPKDEVAEVYEEQEQLAIKKREANFVKDSITSKIGIKDPGTGAILVQPKYDEIRKIFSNLDKSHDLYAVKLNNKYGVITTKGKVILNLEYNYIEGVRYFDGNYSYCFSVIKDKLFCVVNDKNIALVCNNYFIEGGGSGILKIGLFTGKTDRLRYLYDYAKQQFINKIGYEEIDYKGYQEGLLQVKRGEKSFYIDEKGIEFLIK